jgi:hypothetical protein
MAFGLKWSHAIPCSEMLAAGLLNEGNAKTRAMARFGPDEAPRSVQLYGVEVEQVRYPSLVPAPSADNPLGAAKAATSLSLHQLLLGPQMPPNASRLLDSGNMHMQVLTVCQVDSALQTSAGAAGGSVACGPGRSAHRPQLWVRPPGIGRGMGQHTAHGICAAAHIRRC